MNFEETKDLEHRFQIETYEKMPIAVERGSGAWIWTSDGEKYLDLYGGHAVCVTGHSHPRIVKAIQEQAAKLLFYSNLVYSEVRAEAAARLISIAPDPLSKAFFCNSGTEANENAMRMARLATGREKIVSFDGGFHGRTADSISATFLGKYRDIGRPNVPGHESAKFGDISSLERAAGGNTAAIILEPIQSMAGVVEAEPLFFRKLRALCDDRGIVLIFDEVQTGIGRTGNWFFAASELADGVSPDVVTLAKGLGSGVPVGACIVDEKVASKIRINDLGTTFGGGMLAMAAVLATIDTIDDEAMVAGAKMVEHHLRDRLSGVPGITSIRGKGCLLGIEFEGECAPVHAKLLENRIITGTSSDPRVLRLLPPLCVGRAEIDMLVEVLSS